MLKVHHFTFSPFQENTYLLYNEAKECLIIDPGCYTPEERETLEAFITTHELQPKRLLNTHAHLDHVFGNAFVYEKYGLLPEMHRGELPILEAVPLIARQYGIPQVKASPLPKNYLEEGMQIVLGEDVLDILFVPGHSPASIAFYNAKEGYVIGGDVLFQQSVGRTDLPGGDMQTLLHSIRTKFFTLPDATVVHAGHGPATTIGAERRDNPFLQSSK